MFQEFMAFCITQNTCNHFLICRHVYENGPTFWQLRWHNIYELQIERCNSISEWAKTEWSYSLLQNGPTLLIDIFHIAKLTDSTFYCRMDQNFDHPAVHPEFFTGGRKEAGSEVMVIYNLSSILKVMLYKSCLQLYLYTYKY